MTADTFACGCCGYTNFPAGVASGNGPYSIFWCGVCLAMGANPKWAFEAMYGPGPEEGAEDKPPALVFPLDPACFPEEQRPEGCYFNPATDTYIDLFGAVVPITLTKKSDPANPFTFPNRKSVE